MKHLIIKMLIFFLFGFLIILLTINDNNLAHSLSLLHPLKYRGKFAILIYLNFILKINFDFND